MRAVLTGLLIVLLGLGLALGALLFVLDDHHYRGLAIWLVDKASDSTLEISPDFQLDFGRHSRLRASGIALHGGEDLDLSLRDVDMTIDVFALRHEILLVDALTIGGGDLRWKGSSGPAERHGGPPPLLPVVLRAHATGLKLSFDPAGGTEPLVIQLSAVDFDAPDGRSPTQVSATGTVNGRELSVSGELGAVANVWRPPAGGFPVRLDAKSPLATASVAGVLSEPAELKGADLEVDCTVDSIQAALAAFADLPDLGSGHAKIHLLGDLRQPAADDIQVQTTRTGLTMAAQGRARDAYRLDGLALKVFVHADIDKLPDSGFGAFSHVNANATVEGDSNTIRITDVEGSATLASGTQLTVGGHASLGVGPSAASSSASVTFAPQSDPSAGEDPFRQMLRTTGPLTLNATYHYADRELESDLASTGGGTTALSATGRISMLSDGSQRASFQGNITAPDHIGYRIAAELEQTAAGLKLTELTATTDASDARLSAQGTLRAADTNAVNLELRASTSDIGPLLPSMKPALAQEVPLQFEAHLAGTMSEVTVPSLTLTLGDKDTVRVDVDGQIERIGPRSASGVPISGVRVTAHARAPSTTRVAGLFGHDFPHVGTVEADAVISDGDGSLGLDSLHVAVLLKDAPVLALSGAIKDLVNWQDIRWQGTADIELATLLAKWIEPGTDLGTLHGDFLLTDEDGDLGLERFSLSSHADRFSSKLTGSFDDFSHLADLRVEAEINLLDTGLLDRAFGTGHGVAAPVTIGGRLWGETESAHYDGQVKVGRNVFDTKVGVDLSSSPSRWTASVVTSALYPAEMGLAETSAKKTDADRKPGDGDNSPIFPDTPLPFDWLTGKDVSLTVTVQSVVSSEYSLQDLDLEFKLADGVLSVDPIKATFLGGGFQGHARLADADPPEASFTAVGKDVALGDLLALLTARRTLTGQLSLSTALSSRGHSARALASNLDGQIGVVLENGSYPTIYMDLLVADLFGLTMSRITGEHTARIDCGIGRFSVASGVITAKAFFVEGPNMATTGTGTIDLATETLDLTLVPKAKRRVFRAVAPVHVKGAIDDPHVTKLSSRSLAQEVGTLALVPQFYLPVRALGYMYGLVAKDKDTPCLAPADRETLIQGLPTASDVGASSDAGASP